MDGNRQMSTIRETAMAYEPKKTRNIADLDKVSVELQLEDREGQDKDNVVFKYKVAVIEGEEYRVPLKVIGDLKSILEASPDITHFRVLKKGQGVGTTYTVVPIAGGNPSSSNPLHHSAESLLDLYTTGALTKEQYADHLKRLV